MRKEEGVSFPRKPLETDIRPQHPGYREDHQENCTRDGRPSPYPQTFIIHFLNNTGNLAKLKQLLGHSYIKSTEHYLKYALEDIREEYRGAF